MSIIPAISDDFSAPDGRIQNFTSIFGAIPPSPSGSTNIYPSPAFSYIAQAQANKHVDIRQFKELTINRSRTMGELDQYHMSESAFTQTISMVVGSLPESGTWSLVWYDSYGVTTTKTLPFNATQQQVQLAIESFVGQGKVTVTSQVDTGTFPYLVQFSPLTPYVVILQVVSHVTVGGSISPIRVTRVGEADINFLQTADPTNPSWTMAEIESETINTGEQWTVDTRSVAFSQANLTAIRRPEYGQWRALKIILNSIVNPFGVTFYSRLPKIPVNVTQLNASLAQTFVSFVMPDFPTSVISQTNSWIQFTSDPLGKFADEGGSGGDSQQIAFQGNLTMRSVNAEFRANLALFVTAQINLTKITGVRFHIAGNGVNATGQVLTIMALRALDVNWAPLSLDINTLEASIYHSIGLTGQVNESIPQMPPLIRAAVPITATTSDPTPSDIDLSLDFTTGDLTTVAYNRLLLLLRETKTGNTSTFLVGELVFNNTDISLHRYKITRTFASNQYTDSNPDGTISILKSGPLPLPGVLAPLKPNTSYRFTTEALSNGLRVAIYELDSAFAVVKTHFDTNFVFTGFFTRVPGRVGWWADTTGGTLIRAFTAGSVTFSVLRTSIFRTRTPIDGAQLFVEASEDIELFNNFSSLAPTDQVTYDAQKSLSGSSFKFTADGHATRVNPTVGLISNAFTVDDWSHTTVEFDIWLPYSALTSDTKPIVYFKIPDTEATFGPGTNTVGPIQIEAIPGNWSHNRIDLTAFNRQPTGSYALWIVQPNPSNEPWWIDNIRVRRQAISWEMRAIEDGDWVPFGNTVNNRNAALHLDFPARGRALQLQAKALIPEAWISSYSLVPHHAELGRIIPTPIESETKTIIGVSLISAVETYIPAGG